MGKREWFGLLVTALAVAAVFFMLLLYVNKRCDTVGIKMNMNSDWLPFNGCMIEYEPGKWVPLANYRVL